MNNLEEVKLRIAQAIEAILLGEKQEKLNSLVLKSEQQDFWQNHDEARKIMEELDTLKHIIETWERLQSEASSLLEMQGLIEKEPDKEIEKEIEARTAQLAEDLEKAEIQIFLNGKYDYCNCYLQIHAGTGGVDAKDWASMLLDMYLKYCELKEYSVGILDKNDDEVAGISSATIHIKGPLAYGYLKAERGVHRLIRLSPFNAKNLRQTSFAAVVVTPELEDAHEIEIQDKDLRIDTYRSSGAGGQKVNKTDSAVRVTHIPTNIVVTCQNERSQQQNKVQALKILKSRLASLMEEKRAKELSELSGEHGQIDFGHQIRTYTLQPYKLVKDHRTSHETADVDSVLDGEIQGFIEAFLRKQQ